MSGFLWRAGLCVLVLATRAYILAFSPSDTRKDLLISSRIAHIIHTEPIPCLEPVTSFDEERIDELYSA